ncbi:MAG: PKD domain-containing protein [Gemmatimonadaceae bacterium]|nr:PKD domain-containing protein [Gemmatimonadaceae bacterium]
MDNAPVASFTVNCTGLVCTLDGTGSTDDGQIVSYDWDLGRSPNPTATGSIVTVTYPHSGARTVTLTVTDNTGKTGFSTKTFLVD